MYTPDSKVPEMVGAYIWGIVTCIKYMEYEICSNSKSEKTNRTKKGWGGGEKKRYAIIIWGKWHPHPTQVQFSSTLLHYSIPLRAWHYQVNRNQIEQILCPLMKNHTTSAAL